VLFGFYKERVMKFYTVMGYTVTNAEQARSILLVAKLKGDQRIAAQCMAILKRFQA
jgi:hypothetical protein